MAAVSFTLFGFVSHFQTSHCYFEIDLCFVCIECLATSNSNSNSNEISFQFAASSRSSVAESIFTFCFPPLRAFEN